MHEPPAHPHEAERLAALHDCGILDTPPEPDFDDLVALAAHLAQVPIALISLVDRDRQWFKARVGLDAVQTPRHVAFCAHAILDPERPLVVEDAREDPRFAGNPLVDGEPHVISYAGVQLRVGADRLAIGTLCVIDHRPRTLSPETHLHLRTLARHAERLLEVRLRQRQLEDRVASIHRSEARMQAVLQTMDEGLVVQRADGLIISCNPAAERILGMSADQMAGRTSMDPRWRAVRADGSPFPGDQHPAMVALRTGQPVQGVVMGVGVGVQDQRWILIHAQPIGGAPGGPAEQVVSTFSDITSVREKELELIRAKDAAEAANRAKAEFLATMSHEIRTPMNGVIGLTEALLDGEARPEQRVMLQSVQSSGRALLEILNDILDYSKIEAGRLDLELTDVDPLRVVRDVVMVLGPQAVGKGLALEVRPDLSAPATVRADPGRLRQVLFNLIGNALKFTAIGRVTVRLSGDAGCCRFAVEDSGIGIAADDLPRLFQRFTQVDASATRRYGGTGLGLAISKHLSEAMGGSITVSSQPGMGSTFAICIPASTGTPPQKISSHDMPAAGRRLRLLIAEDNPTNQHVARALLTKLGHHVGFAANGIEAVAAWRSGACDLLLMDVQMPEMDGLEATRAIRRLESEHGMRRTPIIALTASAMPKERTACLDAGMDDLIPKPVTGSTLAATLARWA